MAVHAAVPIMLLVTLSLARVPAYILHKKYRTKQKALFIKLSFSLALILYPGLCTRLFSSLKRIKIVGVEDLVLAVDYSINAFQEEHMSHIRRPRWGHQACGILLCFVYPSWSSPGKFHGLAYGRGEVRTVSPGNCCRNLLQGFLINKKDSL